MAYQAGDTILDDQYNTFANNATSPFGYNHFAGTGSGLYGLGESHLGTVEAGGTVKASQWNALFTAMSTVAGHTGDTLTSRASINSGDTIVIAAAVAADLATLAASVASGSPSTTATTTVSQQNTDSASTWTGSFTTVFTVTFSSANAMRHFFNAGGKVRVAPTRTGGGADGGGTTGKDTAWTNLYAAVGYVEIGLVSSSRSGSGETSNTDVLSSTGASDLGTSYTTLLELADDTYPYASNTVNIAAKMDTTAYGTATAMQVRVTATDGASDFTFEGSNLSGANLQAYRNGTHRHNLTTVNTTTAGGLANAHAPSSTATDGGTTT
jgi:hypothetical protein